MNTSAFWSDVSECRSLLRHGYRVREEVQNRTPLRRLVGKVLPWVVIAILALPWWHLLGLSLWFGLVPLIMGCLPAHSPRKLTTFEALHMPSRRALFVARLLPYLPWWSWVGLCGTAGMLLAYRAQVQSPEQAVLWLLIGAQLPGLLIGVLGLQLSLRDIFWGVFAVPVMIGLLIFLAVAGINLREVFLDCFALIPVLMLILGLAILALHLWALNRLEPMQQIQGMVAKQQLLRQASQGRAARLRDRRARKTTDRVGPYHLFVGRHGLGWASVCYALDKFRIGGPLRLWQNLLAALLFPMLMFSLALSDQWWIGIVMFFVLPFEQSLFYVPEPRRLYLLGVDYRTQLRHFLLTFWMTQSFLIIGAGALAAVALNIEAESATAVFALVAGMTLLGGGWYRWPDTGQAHALMGRTGCFLHLVHHIMLGLWLVYLLGAGRWLGVPIPGWTMATRAALFAAACGAFGMAGILHKLLWLTEQRLREVLLHSQPPNTKSSRTLPSGAPELG